MCDHLFSGGHDTTVLSVCTPPPLHLILGIVNCIYEAVRNVNSEIAAEWVKKCNVERQSEFGFNGRACLKLIHYRDVLRTNMNSIMFAEVLTLFSLVIDSCFGLELNSMFKENIRKFSISWLNAKLPATPKFHIIKYHVEQFCEMVNRGLGFYTEQTTEAVHHDFGNIWKKYKVPQISDVYGTKLLRAVCEYNCSHI